MTRVRPSPQSAATVDGRPWLAASCWRLNAVDSGNISNISGAMASGAIPPTMNTHCQASPAAMPTSAAAAPPRGTPQYMMLMAVLR
ncbi:hypothetical protein D3C84_976910 [compost metagenome]